MTYDTNWPEYCAVIGCTDPSLRPHHHHEKKKFYSSIPTEFACTCGNVDLPGTKPKEK